MLRVRSENGTRLQRLIVKHHVRKSWEAFANIRFELVGKIAEAAEITVQFGTKATILRWEQTLCSVPIIEQP
jgi:hypothetical protein